jgi:flagella basal body P-ring formation protein FlgA
MILASTSLYANPTQSLEVLKEKIETYMLNQLAGSTEGKIQVTVEQIDSRLNLKTCNDNHLELFNPYHTPMISTGTMGIKCTEEANHWTLYVPVKVVVLKTVLLTKTALKQGRLLNKDDFYQAEMDIQKLRQGYFTNAKDLVGLVCKNDLGPDTVLTPYNIVLEKLVHRGEEISIIASSGNMNISVDGIAMGDGALGDIIKVKNAKSKRVIEAQVSGKKKVKVFM